MKEKLVGKATIEVLEPLKLFLEISQGNGVHYWDTGRYILLILDNHMKKLDESLKQKDQNELTHKEIQDIDTEIVGCRKEKLDFLQNLRNSAFHQYFDKGKSILFGVRASVCA